MTLDELADAAGVPVARLREWEALGLIGDGNGAFGPGALARVRLIDHATQRGITAEVISAASEEQGDVLSRYLDPVSDFGGGRGRTVDEAAMELGLDAAFVRRIMIAAGFADQRHVYDDDLDMLRTLVVAAKAGLPTDVLLQFVRVFNDSLTRVAEAESRLFHLYVHEPLKAEGLPSGEVAAAIDAISAQMRVLVEPALVYFHHKAFQRALRDDMIAHLSGGQGRLSGPGEVRVTILFIDLASFALMTEVMGDTSAAAVVETFSDIVREAAATCEGRVLKQIGDEFMLVFRDSAAAVAAGVRVMDSVAAEPQFPAVRLGAHTGTAVYREGDYVGSTVNLAARVTSQAARGQFLITAAVRSGAALPDGAFAPIGPLALKGVVEPIEAFEVRRPSRRTRPIDPVCGMTLDPGNRTVAFAWHGDELWFCSEDCRDRFVESPDRYPAMGATAVP